jgi:ribulose-phosphate 3-epimerase
MGIARIGSQGNPFDERVLERIRALKSLYPDLEVSIDGSVRAETLPSLIEAGATRFAVGSAILHAEDPEEAYRTLSSIV